MKNSKRIISVLLALVMLVAVVQIAAVGSFAATEYPDDFSFADVLKDTEWRIILPAKSGAEDAYILNFIGDSINVLAAINSAGQMCDEITGNYSYSVSTQTVKAYNEQSYPLKVLSFDRIKIFDCGYDLHASGATCSMYHVQYAEANGVVRNGILIPNSEVNYTSTSLKEELGDSNWRIDALYSQGGKYYCFRKNSNTAWLENTMFTDTYNVIDFSATAGMLKTINSKGIEYVFYNKIAPGLMVGIVAFSSGSASYQYMYRAFPDVNPGTWYYEPVTQSVMAGIMSGYQNGNFGPADTLKRQDFVVILARVAGADLEPYEGVPSTLSDVTPAGYYSSAVNWAVDNGIISGYENGRFGVNDPITREQVCTILYRFSGSPEVTMEMVIDLFKFTDCHKISAYAAQPLAWAVKTGVIGGMADGSLAPTATASRAQIAAIMNNYLLTVI